MRPVILDVTRLVGRHLAGRMPTGVDRIGLEYVRHFGARATALVRHRGRWVEIGEADSDRLFSILRCHPRDQEGTLRWIVAKSYWRTSSPVQRQQRFLIHTAHGGLEEPLFAQKQSRFGGRPIFFLHDLIPITHPEYGRDGEKTRHEARLNVMLQRGDGIITNSGATARELQQYADARGLKPPRTVAALIAPAPLPTAHSNAPLSEPYFVVLGTLEPRKNHLLLLQAWRSMIERLGDKTPRLIIIGQRGWECENVIDLLERCGQLRGFVIEKSRCSDQELANYLAHARALLFPSFAEGYGMPLAEALKMGLPVIASHLPAFEEIADDIPEYLDPIDGLGWMEMIMDYASPNSPRRQAQLARMVKYETQTWKAHFERVENFLREVS